MSSLLTLAASGNLANLFGGKGRRVYIDNVYFRMHYVWTLAVLVSGAMLVTSKINIGHPITCIDSTEARQYYFVEQYCYIHSTFTLARIEKGSVIYEPATETRIYPGIRPKTRPDEPLIIHGYYQWVNLVLLIQAGCFYFPHWAWKKLERGTVMMLLGKLNLPMTPEPEKKEQRRKILEYLSRNRGHHEKYAKFHIYTEIGGVINLIVQMWVTNRLLDDAFITYGPLQLLGLLQQKPFERTDKLSRLFPTVTSCRLSTGGVAFGRVQKDILCILPINMLSEKIYIVIWFWFLILVVTTIFGMVYRMLTFKLSFRIHMLSRRLRLEDGVKATNCARSVCKSEKYGEWFLIYKLSQNMDPVTFGDFIVDVADELQRLQGYNGCNNHNVVVSVEQVDLDGTSDKNEDV